MNFFLNGVIALVGVICLVACAHNDEEKPIAKTLDATVFSELDPLGLGSPVSFDRRDSNACPGTEGRAMWYAKLQGINAIKLTYGVRFNGSDSGRRHTLSLDPNHKRERAMFCTGDGVALDFEPFVVAVELN